MGQIANAVDQALILSDVDRLNSSNAGAGLSPSATHVILLGAEAGENLSRSNIIAIGYQALKGGATGVGTANADGSAVVGHSIWPLVTSFTGNDGTGAVSGPLYGFGYNIFPNLATFANSIAIGDGIGANLAGSIPFSGNSIYIGSDILGAATSMPNAAYNNVFIGYQAAQNPSNGSSANGVLIGYRAGRLLSGGAGNILIGSQVADSVSTGNYNIIIGLQTGGNLSTGAENVMIGKSSDFGSTTNTRCTVVGANITLPVGNDHHVLGNGISGIPAEAGCVLIGRVAGSRLPGTGVGGHFCIENRIDSGSTRSLMYGQFGRGNLLFGDSALADRNYAAGDTQTVGLLNGTVATLPAQGGRFFCETGFLSFYDQNGTVTPLSAISLNNTVASLPVAGVRFGARAIVNDANAPAFLAAVAGGGAVVCPVFWNGTAWICG